MEKNSFVLFSCWSFKKYKRFFRNGRPMIISGCHANFGCKSGNQWKTMFGFYFSYRGWNTTSLFFGFRLSHYFVNPIFRTQDFMHSNVFFWGGSFPSFHWRWLLWRSLSCSKHCSAFGESSYRKTWIWLWICLCGCLTAVDLLHWGPGCHVTWEIQTDGTAAAIMDHPLVISG